MRSQVLPRPHGPRPTFLVSSHPYERFITWSGVPDQISDGTVIILALAPESLSPRSIQSVHRVATSVRKALAAAAIGGTLLGSREGARKGCRRVLADAGLRFWLKPHDMTLAGLQTAIADAGVARLDILTWLEAYFRPRGVVEHGLLHMLASLLMTDDLPGGMVNEAGRWTRRLGIPPPRRWTMVGKLVRGITELQGDPSTTIAEAARRVGYSESSAFTHGCQQAFGLTPSVIRARLGWEWLLARFLRDVAND